jgi:hypothetical protein
MRDATLAAQRDAGHGLLEQTRSFAIAPIQMDGLLLHIRHPSGRVTQ